MNTLGHFVRFFIRAGWKVLGLLLLLFTSGLDVLLLRGAFAGPDFRARGLYAVFTVFFALLTYVIFRIFFFHGSSLDLVPPLIALTSILAVVFAFCAVAAHGSRELSVFVALLFALQTYALLRARKFRHRTFSPHRPPDDEEGLSTSAPLSPRDRPPTLSAAAEWPEE